VRGEHDFCPKCDQEVGYTGGEFDIETREIYTDDAEKLNKIKESIIS